MKSSVIVFPGSNCDRDVCVALEKLQFNNTIVWHKDTYLPKTDLIVIPGGFSYGDYLRCGAMAAKSKILNEVIKEAKKGCPVLGICNGFQILIEAGLLEGALLRNKNLKFISKDVYLKVLNIGNMFLNRYKKNQVIKLNIAHNDGNYFTSNDHLKYLEDKDLIPLKYCNENGEVDFSYNPNGSLNNIAGIMNNKKNILGMMPHPERMISDLISNKDGVNLFLSLMNA
tara:strand:+ start:896 stop:1576 length:681 start_codon:yes stop_codon:yes gene_type:complete